IGSPVHLVWKTVFANRPLSLVPSSAGVSWSSFSFGGCFSTRPSMPQKGEKLPAAGRGSALSAYLGTIPLSRSLSIAGAGHWRGASFHEWQARVGVLPGGLQPHMVRVFRHR